MSSSGTVTFDYVTPDGFPDPRPFIPVNIAAVCGLASVQDELVLLDSGADQSGLNFRHMHALGIREDACEPVLRRNRDGSLYEDPDTLVYRPGMVVAVGDFPHVACQLTFSDTFPYGILGQDFFGYFRVTFDRRGEKIELELTHPGAPLVNAVVPPGHRVLYEASEGWAGRA